MQKKEEEQNLLGKLLILVNMETYSWKYKTKLFFIKREILKKGGYNQCMK